jgi:hypothetical protein
MFGHRRWKPQQKIVPGSPPVSLRYRVNQPSIQKLSVDPGNEPRRLMWIRKRTKHQVVWQGPGNRRTEAPWWSHHHRGWPIAIALLLSLASVPGRAATFEFEGPYAVRVLNQGLELEITGTFSWAMPQQFGVALAEAPQARVVSLNSPGGHVKAALEVAELIRARNLDTYVQRMCASACTIAFLAGHRRFFGETARLGFHQAHGPNITSADANSLLRLAYQRLSVPPAFIAHVLRTPPADLWIPDLTELRSAGIVTDVAPVGTSTVSAPWIAARPARN